MYLGTHFDAPFRTENQIESALDAFRDGKVHAFRQIIRYVSEQLSIKDDPEAIAALEYWLVTEGKIRTNYKQESTVF